jgi:hypothetical protein
MARATSVGPLLPLLDMPNLAGVSLVKLTDAARPAAALLHGSLKARPPELPKTITDFRVRHDKVEGETIRLLIAGANVRIVREDGQLLRELTFDPSRRYFGVRTPVHNVVRQVSSMS